MAVVEQCSAESCRKPEWIICGSGIGRRSEESDILSCSIVQENGGHRAG